MARQSTKRQASVAMAAQSASLVVGNVAAVGTVGAVGAVGALVGLVYLKGHHQRQRAKLSSSTLGFTRLHLVCMLARCIPRHRRFHKPNQLQHLLPPNK
jgi:hypothetical protein